MTNAIPLQANETQKARKQFGFPFASGMITVPFSGQGQQLVENAQIESGIYVKQKGYSTLGEIAGISKINRVFPYQKDANTHQVVFSYQDDVTLTGSFTLTNGGTVVSGVGTLFLTELSVGDLIYIDPDHIGIVDLIVDNIALDLLTVYTGATGTATAMKVSHKIRAYEDTALIVPTADIDLPSVPDMTTIGYNGYISCDTAKDKRLHRWDGSTLTPITGTVPENPEYIDNEGKRLIVGNNGGVDFSRGDQVPITAWSGSGLGSRTSGAYNTALLGNPTASISIGGTTTIFWETGTEQHNIIGNDSDDAVRSETRVSFTPYSGRGVKNRQQVVGADNSIYFVNPDGLFRMEVGGQVQPIINETSGAIWDRIRTYALDEAVIGYDNVEKMVVVSLKEDPSNVNDRILIFHVETGAVYLKKDIYISSFATVNNQLYGASAVNGEIYKILEKGRFQNKSGLTDRMKVVSEWDGLESTHTRKRLKRFSLFMNLSPESSATFRLYIDGDTDNPVFERTLTTSDATNVGGLPESYGSYVFGLGSPDTDSNSDKIRRMKKSKKFQTFCWEVEENSDKNFEIYGILIEYKGRGILKRNITMSHKQFR